MAHRGPEPVANSRTRVSRLADWVEVPNVPYDGPRPKLPAEIGGYRTSGPVRAWWGVVSAMPHCRLWEASDWLFALDTAMFKAEMYGGSSSPTMLVEMRRREDQMGTTAEARRKLRIRYVAPPVFEEEGLADAPAVTRLADRRRRVSSDAS